MTSPCAGGATGSASPADPARRAGRRSARTDARDVGRARPGLPSRRARPPSQPSPARHLLHRVRGPAPVSRCARAAGAGLSAACLCSASAAAAAESRRRAPGVGIRSPRPVDSTTRSTSLGPPRPGGGTRSSSVDSLRRAMSRSRLLSASSHPLEPNGLGDLALAPGVSEVWMTRRLLGRCRPVLRGGQAAYGYWGGAARNGRQAPAVPNRWPRRQRRYYADSLLELNIPNANTLAPRLSRLPSVQCPRSERGKRSSDGPSGRRGDRRHRAKCRGYWRRSGARKSVLERETVRHDRRQRRATTR